MRDYQAPANLLADRIILVTGAGDGLGRAAALAYARHGATVILLGRTQQKLENVYDEISGSGCPEPLLMPVDLSRSGLGDYQQIASAIDQQFGRLDGLLHSAALLGNLTPLGLYSLETWQQVMQVNFNAAYLLTRACLDVLEKSEAASVVFTTSNAARQGRAYWGAYAAAGAAIENLVQVWSEELGENSRIRMNTLDPGAVRTALRARAYPGEDSGNLPAPEEVMSIYLYLMGKDSLEQRGSALTRE